MDSVYRRLLEKNTRRRIAEWIEYFDADIPHEINRSDAKLLLTHISANVVNGHVHVEVTVLIANNDFSIAIQAACRVVITVSATTAFICVTTTQNEPPLLRCISVDGAQYDAVEKLVAQGICDLFWDAVESQ